MQIPLSMSELLNLSARTGNARAAAYANERLLRMYEKKGREKISRGKARERLRPAKGIRENNLSFFDEEAANLVSPRYFRD